MLPALKRPKRNEEDTAMAALNRQASLTGPFSLGTRDQWVPSSFFLAILLSQLDSIQPL